MCRRGGGARGLMMAALPKHMPLLFCGLTCVSRGAMEVWGVGVVVRLVWGRVGVWVGWGEGGIRGLEIVGKGDAAIAVTRALCGRVVCVFSTDMCSPSFQGLVVYVLTHVSSN